MINTKFIYILKTICVVTIKITDTCYPKQSMSTQISMSYYFYWKTNRIREHLYSCAQI